jgi:hypothetical protein
MKHRKKQKKMKKATSVFELCSGAVKEPLCTLVFMFWPGQDFFLTLAQLSFLTFDSQHRNFCETFAKVSSPTHTVPACRADTSDSSPEQNTLQVLRVGIDTEISRYISVIGSGVRCLPNTIPLFVTSPIYWVIGSGRAAKIILYYVLRK